MPDEIDPNVEWCILFPNGTRVEISNLEDAIAIQQQSNGKAQWRSGWKDLDDLEVGTQKVDFRKS